MGVIERFKAVVPIANPSKEEEAIRDYIREQLRALGLPESAQHIDAAGNLFVRVPGDAARDVIMLSAHMDSVPPCTGIVPVDDNRNGLPIIRSEGRTILGADDKSGIAVLLEIVGKLSQNGFATNHPLELLFSTEEEIGLNGAKGFDMSQSRATYCYVLDGEGRVGMIFNAGPSQENVQILCHGRASHAGIAPEAGISAIRMGAAIAANVPSGRIDHELTTNLGVVTGGNAMNIVPAELTLKGEARSHDEDKLSGLLAQYRAMCAQVESRFPGGTVEFIVQRRYDRFCVPPDHPMIGRVQRVCESMGIVPDIAPMNIGSDAHILNQNGLPTVVLGMGFHYSHSLGEFIFCEELAQVCDLVEQLVV